MPQFDTFTFLSQLFWVFLAFFLLYISLTYYLLPGIAIILKVRRRKLQMSSTTETSVLNSETLFDSNFKTLITSFSNDKSGNKNFITTEILDKFNSVDIQMLQQLAVKTFSEKIEVKILGMILVKRSLKR